MIDKKAMNLYRTYKQHLDKNGNPIHLKDGRWVDDKGQPIKEAYPSAKTEDRPVLTLDDLKKATPLLSKVLSLDKYKNVIDRLRSAVSASESGVVNFVVGGETKIADAILKATFPPGSGVVYKGYDGYSIDASAWTDPQSARGGFLGLLKGRQRVLNRGELNMIREMAKEVSGLDALFDPEAGRRQRQQAQQAPANAPQTTGRGGAPAQPTGAVAPSSQLDATLNVIDKLHELLANITSKKRSIDRFTQDPQIKSQWMILDQAENRCREEIAQMQTVSGLHRFSDWMGRPEFDGSGFMDFKVDLGEIPREIRVLLEPEIGVNKLLANMKAQGKNTEDMAKESKEALKSKMCEGVAKKLKEHIVAILPTLSQDAAKEANKILAILSHDIKTVLTSAKKIFEIYVSLDEAIKDMHGVMVVNNVNPGESGLAVRRGSSGAIEFTAGDILGNEWVSKEVRKKRCMILVSREPISFAFDGYKVVDLSDFSVDEPEGESLIDFFITQYRNNLQKQGVDVANVRVNRGDIGRVNLVLQGKSQASAIQLLTEAFNAAMVVEKKPDGTNKEPYVDGEKLWRSAMELNNASVSQSAGGPDNEGTSRACYYITPRIMMDDYIRLKKSDWGTFVNATNATVDDSMEMMARQDQVRQELWKLEETNGPLPEKLAKEKELANLDNELTSGMQAIPHVMILYGSAGCGKSAYPEALADRLKFQLMDVDFGQARGHLVGLTEKWTHSLIESWKKMANVVIRLDEFDGQVASSEQEKSESWNANVVKQLLSFLQDNKQLLEKRNIFIVATTNNPDRIRTQLQDRAMVQEVPDPFDADGYKDYLDRSVNLLKKDCAKGFIYDPDNPNRSADLWPETKAFMDSLAPDFPRIAKALENSGLNFRKMGDLLKSMWSTHMKYVKSSRKAKLQKEKPEQFKREYPNSWHMENGKVVMHPVKIEGFPMTTENFLKVAENTYPVDLRGVRIRDIQQIKDGAASRTHLGVQDVVKQFEQAREKTTDTKLDPDQMMLALENQQTPESDLITPATADSIASTDYYLNALVKAGIVGVNGEVKQAAKKVPHIRGKKNALDYDEGGSYFYGTIAMVPIPATQRSSPKQLPAKETPPLSVE